ncbi:MAG: PIN domain-containing protein [Flavobacteriaceae bacterium]|nr:PIN domain-containing protein [Flavobacteriaceae bacterium]
MIKKIYIDTSVFGGYFDIEFSEDTIPFFEKLISEKVEIIVSETLELELYRAPSFITDFYESLENLKKVELTEEVENLALKYIEEKVVGRTSLADCQHIALATTNNVDVLVSWNFKHIVNLERIRGYNSINIREGYKMIEIRTPKEIFNYGSNN